MIRASVLILLIFSSCTPKEKEERTETVDTITEVEEKPGDRSVNATIMPFHFSADSAFLHDFELKEEIPVQPLNRPSFGENESVYSYLKTIVSYHQVDEFEIADTKSGKIIYADFPTANLDGTLKMFFLATYHADNSEIDNIRLAKYEENSDVSYLETAELNDLIIKKKIKFMGISDDGSLVDKKTEESYEIDDKGNINKD